MSERGFKLGLIPNDPAKPRLYLENYVKALPPAPATSDYLTGLHFPIWLNDTYGVCVAATLAAIVKVISNRLMGKDYTVTDSQIVTWYRTQNPNFVPDPNNPVQDDGMNIQEFLQYLIGKTLPNGDVIRGFAFVTPSNLPLVRTAIAIGGVIWTGCTITDANRNQWAAGVPFNYVSGSPVDGGHSITVGGEDAVPSEDLRIATWAAIRNASDSFLANQIGEMWFLITDAMLKDKRFVAGMDLATFKTDYEEITGRPFPNIPVTTGVFTSLGADVRMATINYRSDPYFRWDITALDASGNHVDIKPPVVFTTMEKGTLSGRYPGPAHSILLNGKIVYILDRNFTFSS